MTSIADHTETMGAHVGAMRAQHEMMGGGISQLYEALMLAQQLVDSLNAAYSELANGHEGLRAAVDNADAHVGTMRDAAQQQTTDAGPAS